MSRKPKIWILSQLQNSPSSVLLLEDSKKFDCEIALVNPLNLDFVIGERKVYLNGKEVNFPDVILTRMGSALPRVGLHVLHFLESSGVKCVNSYQSLLNSRNKIKCAQLLDNNDIDVPKSAIIGHDSDLDGLTQSISGPPWILKLPEGIKGSGVMKIESLVSLKSTVDAFRSLNTSLLLQEFLELDEPHDIRIFVLNGKCITAVKRTAMESEFRSNIFRGAGAIKFDLDLELEKLAIKTTDALGLSMSGVDVIQSKSGSLVVEVNGSPGIAGTQVHSGVDISTQILEYLLNLTN